MLNKMSILLAATAVVALSAGAAMAEPNDHHDTNAGVSVVVGDPGQTGYGNGYNYGYDDAMAKRERDAHYRAEAWHAQNAAVVMDANGIAFGYRDGYWDNGHQWHRWHDRHAYRAYRNQTGANYHDWNHDRDHDMGWSRP